MAEFHTNPEEITSARQRSDTFHEELFSRMRRNTGKGINGSHGDPMGKQFPPISQAVGKLMFDRDISRYGNSSGDPRHMKVVVNYFSHLGVTPGNGKLSNENIAPGYGVTNLYSIILPKLKKDCEKKHPGKKPVMLMTSPCYGLYTCQPEDCDLPIVTVPLHAEHGWRLQAEDLAAAIEKVEASGEQKVAVFYNMNPHNPTGAVLDEGEMKKLADVFKQKDVYVIDDMIYHGTEFGNKPAKPFASIPGMFERSLTLLGLSKSFCTPGIRAAAACGNAQDIEYIKERNAVALGSIGMPTQVALSSALANDQSNSEEREDYWNRNNKHYQHRFRMLKALVEGNSTVKLPAAEREELVGLVQKYYSKRRPDAEKIIEQGIPGVHIANEPESGYFALIDFADFKDHYCGNVKLENSTIVAAALADYGKTMIMPSAYMLDGENHPMIGRITYALEPERLIKMVRGIAQTAALFTEQPNPALDFDLNRPPSEKTLS